MVLKRQFREGSGEGSSEFPNRAFKRPNAIPRDEIEDSLQELVSKLEPFIRTCVSEEVERGINSYLRRSLQQTDSCPGSRVLQLHFDDKLPSTIFTGCRVETEDSSLVKVVLYDASTRKIITSGPLSSTKVTLVVLDGDFNKEDREDWTQQEFNKRTVKEREGKRPLMTGALVISLKGGVGYIEDVSFTDNSSWTRSGKFQLGAITSEGSIREGISNVFKVKDQRGESYKKHARPSSVDDVWRLKQIAKDGASHKRLSSFGIYNVKDLLRMYVTNPSLLRKILGSKMSNKKWETIVRHANACLLDENELYQYKAADGTLLVLNSIYEVVGVLIDGEHYLSPDMLNVSQKLLVENMKTLVYKNLNCLAPMIDESAAACPLLLPSLQTNSYSSPTLAAQNVTFPVEEDQLESQFDPGIVKVSPAHAYAYGVEAGSQFKVSAGETSHQMEPLNSIFSNSLTSSDSYDELPSCGYGWDNTTSLGPLGFTDQLVVNENFQVETSAWQGNGFFVTPRNPAHGIVSSDFGIRISSNGKSKASWCKIRAIFKWRMIKSCSQYNGKRSKCTF